MKRSFFKLLALPILLFTSGFLIACSDMADDEGNDSIANSKKAPLLVHDAQVLFSKKTIHPADVHSGDHVSFAVQRATRSSVKAEQFSVDWEDYCMVKHDGQDAVLFPLTRKTQTAYVVLTEKGRTKQGINKVISKLIVRRDTVNNELVAVVGTYICSKSYASRRKNLIDTLGCNFHGTDFSGYFIASRLDGTMLAGTHYVKGEEHFSFKANPLLPENRDSSDVDDELHLFLDLKPATVETRATTVDDVDVEDVSSLLCSFCGKTLDQCQCVEILVCGKCGKRKTECKCANNPADRVGFCKTCNSNIVNGHCNCCSFCKQYPCKCNSNSGGSSNNSGNQGGSSGGTQGNGGSTRPGGSGNIGGGNNSTTQKPSYTTTPARLKSAATSSVNTMKSNYGTVMAVCNFGVQLAFKNIFGSASIPPGMVGRANDMVQAWADNPRYWQSISMSEAQNYANNGYFVVAGYKNPSGHGHVVVVVPGQERYSNNWKQKVPNTMDTGKNKRYDCTKLSNGFGPDKKEEIKFYYYKK